MPNRNTPLQSGTIDEQFNVAAEVRTLGVVALPLTSEGSTLGRLLGALSREVRVLLGAIEPAAYDLKNLAANPFGDLVRKIAKECEMASAPARGAAAVLVASIEGAYQRMTTALAPKDALEVAQFVGIQTHLAGLSTEQKWSTVQTAVAAHDTLSLRAVGSAPSAYRGLGFDGLDNQLTDDAFALIAPAAFATWQQQTQERTVFEALAGEIDRWISRYTADQPRAAIRFVAADYKTTAGQLVELGGPAPDLTRMSGSGFPPVDVAAGLLPAA